MTAPATTPFDALVARLQAIVGATNVLPGGASPAHEKDWRGRYQGRALAVVRPASTAEVAQVVRACAEVPGVSIVPQGGNTGLVGGGVPDDSGRQVLLSLARLDAVRRVDRDDLAMTVEAGCILQAAQQAAASEGLLLPLSLAAEGSCTIGGNLATNAGGTQVLRFGTARALCLGLEVVTSTGEVWSSLRRLRKDNTGYDLRDLFVGSEGTLGVITAATLQLFPLPRTVRTGWAACPDLDATLALLRRLRAAFDAELRAFEVMGAHALALTAHHFPELAPPLPLPAPATTAGASAGSHWHVLFELASPHGEDVMGPAADAALEAALATGEIGDAAFAQSLAQSDAMWRWRESIPLAQGREGLNIKHDIGVPTSRVAAFVRAADEAVARHLPGARHVTFGHLGDGNLHYNLQAPVGADAAAFLRDHEALANQVVYDVVRRFDGTISAEHGIGRLKRDELAASQPAVARSMMQELRRALDPRGLFNPGAVLGAND